MIRRVVTAPLGGLVYGVLSVVGLAQLAVIFVLSHGGFPPPPRQIRWSRWLPNLCRRLAARWSGITVPVPYRMTPPPLKPEADGWYREGNELYSSRYVTELGREWDWVMQDPATSRDATWALLNPLVGGLPALLPVSLVAAGAATPWLGWAGSGPMAVAAGVVLAVAGFAAGPPVLAWQARWNRMLLGPTARTGRTRVGEWVMPRLLAAFRMFVAILSALVGLTLGALHLLAIVPGFLLWWPDAVLTSRRTVSDRRARLARWSGVAIPDPYLPEPPPPEPQADGTYRVPGWFITSLRTSRPDAERELRRQWTLRDPASWRDMAWLLLAPIIAVVVAAVPLTLLIVGFGWLVWVWTWTQLVRLFIDYDSGFTWHGVAGLVPGLDAVPVGFAPLIGFALGVVGLALAPAALTAYARVSVLLLGPTKASVLARRVDVLTESRAGASDAQAAELRRIERDLHDGAQAQWVAMGMRLSVIEQLIDRDPEQAKEFVAQARLSSVGALEELRELVRGIHPPVLAERGLGDALRALALDCPLAVEVAVELPGRAEPPVEAALYFSTKELLTNAAKHALATHASVDIAYVDGALRLTVGDDGRGGANPRGGTGLRGVQRRIATFDGTLTLSSPEGGPTSVTLEIPCALSSPRTSTSSEKA